MLLLRTIFPSYIVAGSKHFSLGLEVSLRPLLLSKLFLPDSILKDDREPGTKEGYLANSWSHKLSFVENWDFKKALYQTSLIKESAV